MYSQEGNGNGQREQEVTSPTHYIFEQFQNSYQFRIPFTNPEKIFELLCPFLQRKIVSKIFYTIFVHLSFDQNISITPAYMFIKLYSVVDNIQLEDIMSQI